MADSQHLDPEAEAAFAGAFRELMRLADAKTVCPNFCDIDADCSCNRALKAARAKTAASQDTLMRSVSPVKN